MNTKSFAQQSRRILLEGVSKKLAYWGFKQDGSYSEQPEKLSGGYTFRGQAFDDPAVPKLWSSLQKAVAKHGVDYIVEQAAYTWFNRIMAVKILAKNGYDKPHLEYVEGISHTPQILQKARQGNNNFLTTSEQSRIKTILTDYSKDQEAFAILLIGYCHSNNTLKRVFGNIDDFTELLLPDNMLSENGFLHLLNTTDAISDEEYQEVELIGWLYQFYISEKKDEVFASFKKNKKAEAKDIPAATQIFTPNWIVKYMVQNTVGKIWLDKHPSSALKDDMKYLVQNQSDTSNEPIIKEVSELSLIDPACGSGHILVEGFDLLYKMYMEDFYTPEEAVESIFKNNLYGLDIDDRAAQLANFAVLLKAGKEYKQVFEKDWLPQVYAMPHPIDFGRDELLSFLGKDGLKYVDDLHDALLLMKQAKNLGSTMKFNLPEDALNYTLKRFEEVKKQEIRGFEIEAVFQSLQQYLPVLKILCKKYASVVANPPYMGQKSMNADLKNYVNTHYPLSKSDLFAVFMEVCLNMNVKSGLMGMINQHSWMFLSSYEKLRMHILVNYGIVNMLHLGPRTFEELSGEVVQSTAFVVKKDRSVNEGTYLRLVDFKNNIEKEINFDNTNYRYENIPQKNFNNIPGFLLGYWVSNSILDIFKDHEKLEEFTDSRKGLTTAYDAKFLKYWHEISLKKISFNSDLSKKFFPLNKAGGYRKWYGNILTVINWENEGEELKKFKKAYIRSEEFYFKRGITWNSVSSASFCCRKVPNGVIFNDAGPTIFNCNNENYLMAWLMSSVANSIFKLLCPTLKYEVGRIQIFPVRFQENPKIDYLTDSNITISKKDWDLRETSWDFEKSPLINNSVSLSKAYQTWQEQVTNDFFQLHANEEELNRIFIDIYGLQEELTPEVALKDITILQEELDRNALDDFDPIYRDQGKDAIELPIKKNEVISQYISYAVGLFFGRYRLDKEGLIIAHPNPSNEELSSYEYNYGKVTIDEDAILPIIGSKCRFTDDIVFQFKNLLDTIWGKETRTDNINFIQNCLDKDLEKFIVNDFWKYHCGMYSKKPIYWLFSSPKGAFQVLVYMHRMNEFTVEKIRANYLIEHLKFLRSEKDILEQQLNLSSQDQKKLDLLRKDLVECEEYDLVLKDIADRQISFDLDDGVTENYKLFEPIVAKIK